MARPQRMAKFSQNLRLDLADTFASYGKDLADFFKSALGAIVQAKPHPDNGFLAGRERLQHDSHSLLQVEVDGRVRGRNHRLVLEQVAQARFSILPNGRLQGQRLLRNPLDAPHFGDGDLQAPGNLFAGRFAAQFLYELLAGAILFMITAYMCTGTRIVRALSATARGTA